jgi:hypothetical protein
VSNLAELEMCELKRPCNRRREPWELRTTMVACAVHEVGDVGVRRDVEDVEEG